MRKLFKFLLRTFLALFLILNFVVAMHAYKFTHFYERDEVTIKPKEAKNTWDKVKEIIFGFNFVKQQNSAPDSIAKTVHLQTKDGLKLEAWFIPVTNPKGSVAMFHGHGGKKSGIAGEAEALRRMGYNTLLVDLRAHGNSEGNTCTIGYKEAEDVKLAYEYLTAYGEKNIILWGISLGAASITKSIHDYQLAPSKIILEMPFASMMDAVEGRLKIMGLPAQPIATLLTFWGGLEQGFWAYGLKPSEYVKEINCPVLLQWGRNDLRVSEKETNQIMNNIQSHKKLEIYEKSGHESLFTSEPEKWNSTISHFLQS